MGLTHQTWTLTRKTLLIVLGRHWFTTIVRAFFAPIIYMFFISYSKNFFVPPSQFGVGTATPVRSFADALHASSPSRYKVAFVHNGFTSGDIGDLVELLAGTVRDNGKIPTILPDRNALDAACPSTLRGVSHCFGAIDFHSSPTQGPAGFWNYTILADGTFGTKIYVDQNNNDAEIYVLPFQNAVDSAIAARGGRSLPPVIEEYPYTDRTQKGRDREIVRRYQGSLIDFLSIAYFIGVVGVTYQLVGQMATERELGMSQLIEAMMPNKRRWEPQVARFLSNHLAFDIIYLPGWALMGAIVAAFVFPDSSVGAIIGLHLLVGLALSSYSLLFASFFRRSQLSGISAVIISLLLAIVAQLGVTADASTGAVAVLGLIFPPMTYTFFMMYIASFQQHNRPVNLTEYAPERPWQLSGIVFWVFFIIQILVLPLLAAVVERVLYGTATNDRKVTHGAEGSKVAVRLSSFSKSYRPNWFVRKFLRFGRRKPEDEVLAVNNVTLDVLQGQIMILLGANGSGKSTTLDAIAGLNKITSGEIEIDGTGGLGLCPQKNVLWDELTVFEHVMIFNRLKTTEGKAIKSDARELVKACDLEVKMDAKAKTLSGGQKRKLQLAMMFTGGSRVACVDEVSSGIDPLARRKIWDILLAERGRRTILLTTHFLDEADVLSDHIAILSKGALKAEGSAVELKHKLGSGYRVIVENSSGYVPSESLGHVSKYLDYDKTVYHLPTATEASRFAADLDRAGNRQYYVEGPTVEDVFLKVAEEIKEDFGPDRSTSPPSSHSEKSGTHVSPEPRPKERPLDLLSGQGTRLLQQAWILFIKRFTVLKHNYLPYVFAVAIPFAAAGLVTLWLQGFTRLGCNPEEQSSNETGFDIGYLSSPDVIYGPPSRGRFEALSQLNRNLNSTSLHAVDSLAEFNNLIRSNFSKVIPGGFFLGTGNENPTFAYLGNYYIYPAVVTQNLLNNMLSDVPIGTVFQPLSTPFSPQAGDTLLFILFFGLAMCAYTGFFSLYPTAERVQKVRALHYSNGVRSVPLWVAYITFDFLWVLLISVLVIVIFVAQFSGWYWPGHLFVVLFLFGLASIAFAYFVSLFAASQLAAFAFTAGTQASLFLSYFIAYMCIITYAPPEHIADWINIAHFTIGAFTPAGMLLRALLLTFNEFSLLCNNHEVRSYPGDILVYGGPILYLVVQFLVLMIFVTWWDSGGRISLPTLHFHNRKDIEQTTTQDHEVFEEASRVASSNDSLRALHLTKNFGPTVAIEDVTFGLRQGEIFALLGPNGAGKSTIISLVRGDLRPSTKEGEVTVEGHSLMKHRASARNNLGVCPQFDAMDQMTVTNHLRFYARIRGVPDADHNVREVIRAVGLQSYASRMAARLSGGNKRKLSLAIALMGNPSVLLLDEPSSGMDAVAKRVMWRVLGSVTQGRALLITTHSMEEADALAERAGILARRMLALGTVEALRKRHGDAHHVHIVHKDAPHTSDADMARLKAWVQRRMPSAVLEEQTYHGQLRFSVPNAPAAPEATKHETSYADDDDEISRGGEAQGKSINALFDLLEAGKEELGCAYYAVQPTTLDNVFLNVVMKHDVEEENYTTRHRGLSGGKGGGIWKGVREGWRKIISDG